MKIPRITGIIDRRILVNFQVEPEMINKILPSPFKANLVNGKAMAGICLIRLKEIRPKGFPAFLGISSENGAHRIAVEWENGGKIREGVYIPRRDTSSRLNNLAGGNIFPGKHHLATFRVEEGNGLYKVEFTSDDSTSLSVLAKETTQWNPRSIFPDLKSASAFYEKGATGFSPSIKSFEGLKLHTENWKVSPLEVTEVHSSFFENREIFPEGSVKFDNALLMKNILHEWEVQTPIYK